MKQGLLILLAGAILVMALAGLSGAVIWWRGGDLPEVQGQIGAFRIVGRTTVAPSCMPGVFCTQKFADVPLPHYYVIWVISQNGTDLTGTRILTIPLQLSVAQ